MARIRFKRLALVGAALVGTIGFAVTADAAPSQKSYIPSATGAAGAPTVTFRLENNSRNNIAFGSAEITPGTALLGTYQGGAAPVTLAAPVVRNVSNNQVVTQPSGASAQWNGTKILIRDVNVPKGAYLTVTAPFAPACGTASYSFSSEVRQSNQFLGQNNDFILDSAYSNPTSFTVTGLCRLVFTSGPSDATTTTRVVTTVTAQNGSGDTLTGFAGQVTLTVTGTSSPTWSVTASAGVASFTASTGPLISTVGRFTLTASAVGFTSAESASFLIGATCDIDTKPCETGPIQSPNVTASVLVNDSANQIVGTLQGYFTTPDFDCVAMGYTRPLSDQLFFNLVTNSTVGGLSKTVTYTVPFTGAVEEYQVCYQAPYQFPALDLRTLNGVNQFLVDFTKSDFSGNLIIGGTAEAPTYTGLLLPCEYGETVGITMANGTQDQTPCVASRTANGSNLTVVVVVPAKDPGLRIG